MHSAAIQKKESRSIAFAHMSQFFLSIYFPKTRALRSAAVQFFVACPFWKKFPHDFFIFKAR